MRMNRKAALAAGATLGVAFLAACSDSPTAPAANVVMPKSNFAVGAITATATPTIGEVFVCKVGNTSGAFTFTRQDVGPAPDPGHAVAANQSITQGTCLDVAHDLSVSGSGSNVVITEGAAPANTVQTVESCLFIGKDLQGNVQAPVPCSFANGGTVFINSFHGYVITYRNTFTPPPPPTGCTFTKGWYRNNGSNTVTAVDGRTKAEAQAIFNATPGKPGGVTFGDNNDLLNLYQQLLAAILNGGLNGPQSVKDAIAAAQAATGGTGLNITVVPGTDIGALITPLDNFNEGNVAGFPHCADPS